jgi:hypothetical protein
VAAERRTFPTNHTHVPWVVINGFHNRYYRDPLDDDDRHEWRGPPFTSLLDALCYAYRDSSKEEEDEEQDSKYDVDDDGGLPEACRIQ